MGRKVAQPSFPATKSIVNAFSTNGYTPVATSGSTSNKTVACGALTANTLATVLSVTGGSGSMEFLSAVSVDATARTLRVQVIVDGVTVFDSTSASTSAAQGCLVVGQAVSGASAYDSEPLYWNNSLTVKVASSLTETDKFNIAYRYKLT